MKEWIHLPQEIRDIGQDLLDGKEPSVPGPLPMSSEFSEAQRVVAERFRLQMRPTALEADDLPNILEGDGSRMVFVKELPFSNWGGNVNNIPLYTFVAKSVGGVQNLVKWCKSQNYKM
jgi:hypothetical protein